jgi:putative hydrolase of the HAD superfamily
MKLDPHADAVFFDMDGTLLDWQTGLDDSWRAVCTNACGELDGIAAEALFDAIVARRTWFWTDDERAATGRMDLVAASCRIVEMALGDLGCDAPGLARRTATAYRELRESSIALIPGAVDTLERLRAHGIATALITNGAAVSQRRSVERFGLARYFDCIVIEGEFGCGKPDERVFRHALAAVGHPPERAWMIGDNLVADIATPVRLGMHTVWIDEAGAGLPDGTAVPPHRVIRTIAELLPA